MRAFSFLIVLVVQSAAFRTSGNPLHLLRKNLPLKNAVLDETSAKKGGDASIASTTFNVAKSIIGAGVLSLPSGVAFFADETAALVPAGNLNVISEFRDILYV